MAQGSGKQPVSRRWAWWAMAALVLVAPFNLVGRRSGGPLLQMIVPVALVIGVVVIAASLGAERLRSKRVRVLDAVVVSAAIGLWLSVALSDDRLTSAAAGARVSVMFVVALATAHTVIDRPQAAALLRFAALGTLLGALIGVSVLIAGGDVLGTSMFFGNVTQLGPYDRLTRPWSHANVAAMAIGVTIAGAALFSRLRWVSLAVLTVAMVATYSRGGILALVVAAALGLALARPRPKLGHVASVAGVGVIAALLLPGWLDRASGPNRLDWYQVGIEAPAEVALGADPVEVAVQISNDSSVDWPSSESEQIWMSARWVEPGTDRVWAEHTWRLHTDLDSGVESAMTLTLAATVPDGTYDVWWDLVVPRRAYFRQFSGLDPVISQGVVTDAAVARPSGPRGRIVAPRSFPGRATIFAAAIDAWSTSPWFGVGPGRLASTMDPADRVSHAHNLALEPLATWGLLATVPLLVLLGGAGWFGLRAATRWRDSVSVVVAVSWVAIVVHGVVDFALVHASVGIPIGVIVGLAWTIEGPDGPGAIGLVDIESGPSDG